MKKTLSGIIVIFSAALLFGGCSAYNKLLKSGDRDLMYRTALEYFDKGKYDKTLQLFEEVIYYYQGTPREDTIMYYTGMAYYNNGDFGNSEIIFDDFRRRYGRSPFIEDVEYMYAMGFYHSSPDPDRDQTVTLQAMVAISDYMERYPESIFRELCLARLDELQNKLYDKELINARTYYKTGYHKSAVIALKNALAKYPQTPHREEILYLTTKSSYELAYNSVPSLQRERYLSMMDTYYTFVAEFPDSKHRKEVDRMQQTARDYIAAHPIDGNTVTETIE